MNNKLVMDFTMNVPQDVAIMPASLAKKLLRVHADILSRTSAHEIVNLLIESLKPCKNQGDLNNAVQVCQDFVNERLLIDNILKENWDAYKTESISNFEHMKYDVNQFRIDAQDAMNKSELYRCSELINMIAGYGSQEAEDIFSRLYQQGKEIIGTIESPQIH